MQSVGALSCQSCEVDIRVVSGGQSDSDSSIYYRISFIFLNPAVFHIGLWRLPYTDGERTPPEPSILSFALTTLAQRVAYANRSRPRITGCGGSQACGVGVQMGDSRRGGGWRRNNSAC